MVENADNAAVHGVGQDLAAKMPTGSFWTATVPGDNRGRAFPSDELRDAERSVLDDALSNMPKRNRYVRGQHRSIAEARLAAARERAAKFVKCMSRIKLGLYLCNNHTSVAWVT
jgi:hypothetical protein